MVISSHLLSLFGGKHIASLKAYAEVADSVHLVLVDNRWVNQEKWEWYILNVIVPFCEGHAAAFVVDSHSPHISPESVTLGEKRRIITIQVARGSDRGSAAKRCGSVWSHDINRSVGLVGG